MSDASQEVPEKAPNPYYFPNVYGYRLYVYGIWPIDFWGGWTKESNFIFDEDIDTEGACYFSRRKYDAMLAQAKLGATKVGWQGDIREGPFLSSMPDPPDSHIVIAWKQDNGGLTFVASEAKLPWLEEHCW